MTKSALQIARAAYQPKLPQALKGHVKAVEGAATQSVANQEEIKELFPNTYGMPVIKFEATDEPMEFPTMNVGVILSGGQAPGGHNVISGLFDGIKKLNPANRLYGFILGPGGLVDHKYMELTADIIDEYRNTGGFDIIGSGRTKLEKVDQFEKGYEILKELGIKALVIIGGDDSNTNACVLAEYYAAKQYGVQVIGCPKTIDGDLKNEMIETSFGFDTACKTYSEVIGNIQRDCNSARKYWHFIKLMGRSASHIALECALQVQPNICLISEEIEAKNMSLDDVVTYIAQIVANRAAQGNNFGTMLVKMGIADSLLGGATYSTADTVRPALQLIKTKPGSSVVSSCFILVRPSATGDNEVLAMGDCAINIKPTEDQLVEIAYASAECGKVFGIDPKVAFLSYSTLGSGKGEDVDKMRNAAAKAKAAYPDLPIEGEIQFDAAVSPRVAKTKCPDSAVAGHANVFIFPDINAGNIGYKIAQRLGNFEAYGPILLGLNAPINDLSRGCNAEEVYSMAIITAALVED